MVASLSTADQLSSKRALARHFAGRPAVVVLTVGLAVAAGVRTGIGGWGTADVIVAVIAVVLIGPVEWLIHGLLFHAPADSVRSRRWRTGHRHHLHHDRPSELQWLLLDVRGVLVLMVGVAAVVAASAIPLSLFFGQPWPGPFTTSVVLAWLALANYEWTHLLIHSRYRARTRRYRRLVRNHLAHHHRDDSSWLGVTTNLGDRLFGTESK